MYYPRTGFFRGDYKVHSRFQLLKKNRKLNADLNADFTTWESENVSSKQNYIYSDLIPAMMPPFALDALIKSIDLSLVRSFVGLLVLSFVGSFPHSFVRSFVRTFVYPLFHSFIHSFMYLLVRWLVCFPMPFSCVN